MSVLTENNCSSCNPNYCYSDQYLKKKNYLSEFRTKLEKLKARENLGIQNPTWGDIIGDIKDQEDLYLILRKYQELIDQLQKDSEYALGELDKKIDKELPGNSAVTQIQYNNSSYVNIETLKDALDYLLNIPIEITLNNNIDVMEKGEIVQEAKFTWSYNKTGIVRQVFDGKDIDASIREYTITGPISESISKTLVAYDEVSSASATSNINFYPGIYYGTAESDPSTVADIIKLERKLRPNLNMIVNLDIDNHLYFCIPYQYGAAEFLYGSVVGGFTLINDEFIFERYKGTQVRYRIYKSDNKDLGNTTVTVRLYGSGEGTGSSSDDDSTSIGVTSAKVIDVKDGLTASASVNLVDTELQFQFVLPKGKNGSLNDFDVSATAQESDRATASATIGDNTLDFNFGIPPGQKGDPFTYNDFTPEQLAQLKGKGVLRIDTKTSDEDEGYNYVTIYLDDGTSTTFTVKNGSKGKQGAKGETSETTRTFTVYKATKERVAPEKPEGGYWLYQGNGATDEFTPPQGWVVGDSGLSGHIWMSNGIFRASTGNVMSNGWSPPICISGEAGRDGVDGNSIEYIYHLHPTSVDKPYLDVTDSENVTGYVPGQTPKFPEDGQEVTYPTWQPSPQGISDSMRAEYVAYRELVTDSTDPTKKYWGNWVGPTLWSKWGANGKDGDGVQYIFYRNNGEGLMNPTPSDWETNTDYQDKYGEYIPDVTFKNSSDKLPTYPDKWTDDPQGVNINNQYEWVSIRRYKMDADGNGKWMQFSDPGLWSKFGKDGQNGLDGYNGLSIRTLYREVTIADNGSIPSPIVESQWAEDKYKDDAGGTWSNVSPAYDSKKAIWKIWAYFNYRRHLATVDDGIEAEEAGWHGPILESGVRGLNGTAPDFTTFMFTESVEKPLPPTGLAEYGSEISYTNPSEGFARTWYPTVNTVNLNWWGVTGQVNGATNTVESWGDTFPMNGKDGVAQDGKATRWLFGVSNGYVYQDNGVDIAYNPMYDYPSLNRTNNNFQGFQGLWPPKGGSSSIATAWEVNSTDLIKRINANEPKPYRDGVLKDDQYLWGIYAEFNPDGSFSSANPGGWLGPIRITGARGVQGPQGPTGERGPSGKYGISGIPGVSFDVRYCVGTETEPKGILNSNNEFVEVNTPTRTDVEWDQENKVWKGDDITSKGWSKLVPTVPCVVNDDNIYNYIWCLQGKRECERIIHTEEAEDSSGNKYVIEETAEDSYHINWEAPFRLNGINGQPGQPGQKGQIIYPAGMYDVNKAYQATETKAPYVYDPATSNGEWNGGFFIYNSREIWIGTKHSGMSPHDDTTHTYWVEMESFEALYTKVGIIANGTIGEAVFNNEFMFSQKGMNFAAELVDRKDLNDYYFSNIYDDTQGWYSVQKSYNIGQKWSKPQKVTGETGYEPSMLDTRYKDEYDSETGNPLTYKHYFIKSLNKPPIITGLKGKNINDSVSSTWTSSLKSVMEDTSDLPIWMTICKFNTYGGQYQGNNEANNGSSTDPVKISGYTTSGSDKNSYAAECRFFLGEATTQPDCDLWAREPHNWTLSTDLSLNNVWMVYASKKASWNGGTSEYQTFNKDYITGGTFTPNILLDFKEGKGHLGCGNIKFDSNGVYITGEVNATSGKIGGFSIAGNNIINNGMTSKLSFTDSTGNDSIALNSNFDSESEKSLVRLINRSGGACLRMETNDSITSSSEDPTTLEVKNTFSKGYGAYLSGANNYIYATSGTNFINGLRLSVNSVLGSRQIKPTDDILVIKIANSTMYLPYASAVSGKVYFICKAYGIGGEKVYPKGSDKIIQVYNSQPDKFTFTSSTGYGPVNENYTLVSDGIDTWYVMDRA